MIIIALFISIVILCITSYYLKSKETNNNITQYFHPEIERYYNIAENKNYKNIMDMLYNINKHYIENYSNVKYLETRTHYIKNNNKLQTIFNFIDCY
jgi:hypothetical protein